MALTFATECIVTFTCRLTDEEEKKVIEHIEENPKQYEFMSPRRKILKAIEELWDAGEINIYDNAVESDSCTSDFNWSEYETRTAEEILEEKE